jgi:hypothetical protein
MVPELLFGDEYGVGVDRRLGTVTTTTLTDYAFPRDLPGEWVMVASSGETPVFPNLDRGIDVLRFSLRHVVIGQLDWGSRILVRPGTEWFAEGYGSFRASAHFSFYIVRLDGTTAAIAFAVAGDTLSAPDSEVWFGLHVRYPDVQAGTAHALGGGALQLQRVGGSPRLWGRGFSFVENRSVEATYGTLVGERDPFDEMLRGSPPDAPPPRLASEIVINVNPSFGGTMFWTKLWVRA